MVHGRGFGKVILFGEHFVVYGLPGIVAALDKTIDISVEQLSAPPYQFIDKTKKFSGVEALTWKLCQNPLMSVLKHLGVDDQPLKIIHGGDLPIPHSGIGSSAASLVAFARAVNNTFHLNLSDEQINRAAFEGEKEVHGIPSGIDNTAATYGGMFWFAKKETGENVIEPITLQKPIEIVLVESGVSTIAKTVIEALKTRKEQENDKVDAVFDEYRSLVSKARTAIKNYDLLELGKLMNKNHELLKSLTISCDELNEIVALSRRAGALGAKLTGAGRGGLAVALTPGKALQDRVAKALVDVGYEVLKTSIG